MSERTRAIVRVFPVCFWFASLGLLAASQAGAQYEEAPRPAAWALQDVTVVHGDGRVDEGMTLVIRAGVIERLEAGAEVPADARLITREDAPLHVYPGIVDGDGGAGVELPDPDRDGVDAWDPTREVQHLTPHRRAFEYLEENEEGLAGERRAGVVASVIHPGRGVFPGQPSLILHVADARDARGLVLRPSLGVGMSLQGARGAYPSTLMAVQAFIRQSFLDADHYRARTAAREEPNAGLTPAPHDDDMQILHQVATGERPVFFRAAGPEDVRRVLALADEIGFRPVIVDGEGIGGLAGELASRGVPVLLSADLPPPDDWDPDAEEELTPAAARERERLLEIYRTAGRLEAEGASFALTSGGEGGRDLLDGVRRFVEHGLSPEGALEALTVAPSRLLGVPDLVRLEEGSAAHLIVTDGELLDEDTRILWSFVNGLAEEGRAMRDGDAAEPDAEVDAAALVGTWEGEVDVGPETQPLTVELSEGPEGLVGRARGGGDEWVDLQEVTLEGTRITMEMPVPEIGATSRLEGTVEDDRMSGTGRIGTPQGEFEFEFRLRRVPEGGGR